MDYAVSVTDTSKAIEIEKSGLLLLEQLEGFSHSLNKLTPFEPPRGIVFHDLKSATELYSTIPLPAYTSRDLIHITPLVETWKRIFLSTSHGLDLVEAYYNNLEMEDVTVIAAHELTHHATFFNSEFENWDEEDPEDMWFEEGMCFYVPRKLILSSEKFEEIMKVECRLVEAYKGEYGEYPLNQFGESGYRGRNSLDYSAAFYDYWRSTITVKRLVEDYCNGEVQKLIFHYRDWIENKKGTRLQEYFIRKFHITEHEAKQLWLE